MLHGILCALSKQKHWHFLKKGKGGKPNYMKTIHLHESRVWLNERNSPADQNFANTVTSSNFDNYLHFQFWEQSIEKQYKIWQLDGNKR